MDAMNDENQIHDTFDLLADGDEGPSLAVQVDQANAAITDRLRLLAATEGEISDAMALRDVESIVRLRATRDALASVIRAMRADRDVLYAKHGDQLAREAREQREAALDAKFGAEFDGTPQRESYPDPTDPNTTINRVRFQV